MAKSKKGATVIDRPDRILSYFKPEIPVLLLITLTGIIYNIGLTAGPYFEGQLAKCLLDITNGNKTLTDMLSLAVFYLAIILLVQLSRAVKRFFIRRFANDTSRNMRSMLYNRIVHTDKSSFESESVGTVMTKAITDVDACVEGMRKFTTEIFDTGVALVSYLVMLFVYDWRLSLISCAFVPIAYFIADNLKKVIYKYNSEFKKSADALNDASLDRVENAVTYRVFGREKSRDDDFEKHLTNYEKKAVSANVWERFPQPLYNIISMTGVIFIICIGAKNINGTGWTTWDIAAFTAYISCFAKMAVKSSKAAKLFNSVQKAQVSWARIKPLMHKYTELDEKTDIDFKVPCELCVNNLSFTYPDGSFVFGGLSFSAKPGEIIGVTGPVACGKSTLGKAFLCETPYRGSVKLGGREVSSLSDYERSMLISYLGHNPELMSDTIDSNIRLGGEKSSGECLSAVRLDGEVAEMPEGDETFVGSGGIRLSGGQQARLALARTLYSPKRLIILDDPFSAVDRKTEREITENLKNLAKDSVVLLISHRVSLFPEFDKIIWMDNSKCIVGTHDSLIKSVPEYAGIFALQTKEGSSCEK